MKSKRTGRDLPFIKIKCDNPKQAKALILCGEAHSHKNCPNKDRKPQNVQTVGPHVGNYRGCPAYKIKLLGNMWSIIKFLMPPL